MDSGPISVGLHRDRACGGRRKYHASVPVHHADGPAVSAEGGEASRKTELSRRRVVEAALAILDSEGVCALSMRHLADVLGVGTMSLYHYVTDKDDLTDAVIELVLGEVHRPDPGDDWVDMCREVATSFRAAALAHPDTIRLYLIRPPTATTASQWDTGGRILREAGMTDEQRRRVFRAVSRFLVGWCLAEIVESADGDKRRVQGDGDFAFALDALLDALAQRIR